ncbi:hypothetical protein VTO42DRAFT_2484 [Malbranchea cinnamomea]
MGKLQGCHMLKDPAFKDVSQQHCRKVCAAQIEESREENCWANWGCIGFFSEEDKIPWETVPGFPTAVAPGRCFCNDWFMNEIIPTVIEALPVIAQIGCFILMSTLKLVLDIGSAFYPWSRTSSYGWVGYVLFIISRLPCISFFKALTEHSDMAITAAKTIDYIHPPDEDPGVAFNWWLSPCGGTDLVPDDIRKIYDILSGVADGISRFTPPENISKESGRKGDEGNLHDQSTLRSNAGGTVGHSSLATFRRASNSNELGVQGTRFNRNIAPGIRR